MTSPGRTTPTWRQVFDNVERAIGGPLEDLATSQRFVDVAVTGMKARRAVTGTTWWLVGGAVNRVLRTANIATRDDVKRLTAQVAVLASEVRTNSASDVQTGVRTFTAPAKATAPAEATARETARPRPDRTRPPTGTSAPSDGMTLGSDIGG